MTLVHIYAKGAAVILDCPWNAQLATDAADLGGRWDSFGQVWQFGVAHAHHVVALARDLFGTDGTSPLLTCQLDLSGYSDFHSVVIGGRTLVLRESKTRRPTLDAGVVRVCGGFTFEGTGPVSKATIGRNNAVIEFQLPKAVAAAAGLLVVPTRTDRDALLSEAARLQTRLAVVMQELAS